MSESGPGRPSVQRINRALTSISVASAHVQLVRRWLERGRVDRTEQMVESLRISEQALQESAATIRDIGGMSPGRSDPPSGAH